MLKMNLNRTEYKENNDAQTIREAVKTLGPFSSPKQSVVVRKRISRFIVEKVEKTPSKSVRADLIGEVSPSGSAKDSREAASENEPKCAINESITSSHKPCALKDKGLDKDQTAAVIIEESIPQGQQNTQITAANVDSVLSLMKRNIGILKKRKSAFKTNYGYGIDIGKRSKLNEDDLHKSMLYSSLISINNEEEIFSDIKRDLSAETPLSVKSVTFDLDSSRATIFDIEWEETTKNAETSYLTGSTMDLSLAEFKDCFPTGSARMPEDATSSKTESNSPAHFKFVKKNYRIPGKAGVHKQLNDHFFIFDMFAEERPVRNWFIVDSAFGLMNEKCLLDHYHSQGSLITRVPYPQVEPQDIADQLRKIDSLPPGMIVYIAIGYDFGSERGALTEFECAYRDIVHLFKRRFVNGYRKAAEQQMKAVDSYTTELERKKGAKNRCLHRAGRKWLQPPRLVLINIPNEDGDETTKERCAYLNDMILSLVNNANMDSSCSSENDLEVDPYADVGQICPELLDWQAICSESKTITQNDRLEALMIYLRDEMGVVMNPTNRFSSRPSLSLPDDCTYSLVY